MAGKRGGARPGAGRKKGQVSQAKRAISEMAKEHGAAALKVLVEVARSKAASDASRVSAANAILDRAYGRPAQSHQHSGPGGAPIQTMDVTNLSDDQLAALETAFGGLADAAGGDPDADPGGEGTA